MCGNYTREETNQGRKLYEEIRYLPVKQIWWKGAVQCETDIRICNWSQINCLKKSQIFKKGISFKNNSEKNIRLVISCFFRFWLATPNSTINSSKFTMWPKKWNLLFSWTKCCENILSNLCEKWSQWNISLKSHFLI